MPLGARVVRGSAPGKAGDLGRSGSQETCRPAGEREGSMADRTVRLLTLFLVVSGVSGAQQLPSFHDQVVVTATGDEQPVDGVAAACTVISAAELRSLGVTSVADALRWVPGVVVLRCLLYTSDAADEADSV